MKEWIKKTLSESNDAQSPSLKRQALAFSILVVSGVTIASFVTGKEITQSVITLLQTLLITGGSAYTIGRFSENKESGEEK